MRRYLVARLAQTVLVVFLSLTAVFGMVRGQHAGPGEDLRQHALVLGRQMQHHQHRRRKVPGPRPEPPGSAGRRGLLWRRLPHP